MSARPAIGELALDARLGDHMADDRRLLTPEQLAEQLAVPVTWIRQEARAGRIPSLKLGHYRRFVQADVDDWLEKMRSGR